MMTQKTGFGLILAASASLALPLAALADGTIQVLVGEKDSPAAANAEKMANGTSIFAEKSLQKAFDTAIEKVTACGTCTVLVKVAGGAYQGKGGSGQWIVPEVKAPGATLRFVGGYDNEFKARDPFARPSVMVGTANRSAPMFTMDGKNAALKEFQISGFVMDVAPGNKYDAKSNSLKRGESCTFPILNLGYLQIEKMTLSDNILMNAAQRGVEPLPRAANPNAEIIVRNNFFLNNVLALKVDSARFRNKPKRYAVTGNSFISNWPYNPDPNTSNPAAVQVGPKDAAEQVEISDNLFAFNVGGAIMPGYDDKAGPKIAIRNNLFHMNGVLFGKDDAAAGMVVGKFNRAATYGVYTPTDLEDFSWEVKGNQVADPQVGVSLVKPGVVDSNSITAEKTWVNDVRSMFGQNLQGGTAAISNFAPRMGVDLKQLPFPRNAAAKAFGVSVARVEQF